MYLYMLWIHGVPPPVVITHEYKWYFIFPITNPTSDGVMKFKSIYAIYLVMCCASNPISQYSTYELILKKTRTFF